jgi:hypothetical protein
MKKLLAAALPIICLALVSSPASARVVAVSGNACTPANTDVNCAAPGQWGMGNACSDPITVVCPLSLSTPTGGSVPVSGITFWAFDRHTQADVSCTFHMTDESGTDAFTPSVAATSGFGTAVIPKSFSFSAFSANGSPMWASCTIPGFDSAHGYSHLVTFKVTTSD